MKAMPNIIKGVPPLYLAAAGLAAVAWLYVASKGTKQAGQAVGGAAVNLVDGVVSGTVVGTGELFGLPATNLTACERAKLEGRTWDASFACPAKDFITYLWN
jgi:hypothetical protein